MKILLLLSFSLLYVQVELLCQPTSIENNFTKIDSAKSPLIDSFIKKYDFVLAYTEEASPNRNYKILARHNRKWTCWTFSDSYIQLTQKGNSLSIDSIPTAKFWLERKKIARKKVESLMKTFSANDFWLLNNDSLNKQYALRTYIDEDGDTINQKDKGLTDQSNHRFEIFIVDSCQTIQSYDPEYFVEKYKEIGQRKKFVECKNAFLKWWSSNCR